MNRNLKVVFIDGSKYNATMYEVDGPKIYIAFTKAAVPKTKKRNLRIKNRSLSKKEFRSYVAETNIKNEPKNYNPYILMVEISWFRRISKKYGSQSALELKNVIKNHILKYIKKIVVSDGYSPETIYIYNPNIKTDTIDDVLTKLLSLTSRSYETQGVPVEVKTRTFAIEASDEDIDRLQKKLVCLSRTTDAQSLTFDKNEHQPI
jgi:hypothetical protein